MARKVIVTIVSDQTVPNVLFIKECGDADLYIFITSEKMERFHVSKNIINAANIDLDSCKPIEVIEDSLLDIDTKLSKVNFEDDDQILVNITGGTKIMSLGVYNYFARNGAADIFYIPIGKNEIRQIFPLRKNRSRILNYRINLLDYLKSYGVSIEKKSFASKNLLLKNKEETEKFFNASCSNKRNDIFRITELIRTKYRGKKIKKELNENDFQEARTLSNFGIDFEEEEIITAKETKYLTGDWFEEYVYFFIKSILNIDDNHIGLGVQLVKAGAPNEYDIIFTHKNAIYVIECKTDISDHIEGKEETKLNYLFTNTLYKAATLKKEFGLWVNYYLFALNDFSELTEIQNNRAKQLDIKLVGLDLLSNKEKLSEFIKKM